MSARKRLLRLAAGALGVAAAGTAVGVAHRRRVRARPGAGDATPFGSLRSAPITVVADDGVPLHVEVDEYDGPDGGRHRTVADGEQVTVVFVHGYALNLDCWHFQRAGYRGLVRSVYYDQRSHGRSGRSPAENASIDQLGLDLRQVLDQVVPEGRVVLVGHSMGGMTVMSLAEHHPELFGERITGVALVSTTAGGLSPHRILLPMLPRGIGGEASQRAVAALARTSRVVDGMRKVSGGFAAWATQRFAFGGDVPDSYVKFVHQMLSQTPFDVLAEFFPHFESLDKFAVLEAFERVPTTIICGTEDKVTSIGHSRKLHSLVPGTRLVELDGAGHMVIMERHAEVNEALDKLIAAAVEVVPDLPEGP